MKKTTLRTAFAAGLALALAGCMTDAELRAERINNNPVLYAQLDPATQSRIAQGLIAIGDTQQAVWLALGEPGKRTSDTTAAGSIEIWQYLTDIPEEYTVLVPDSPPPGVPLCTVSPESTTGKEGDMNRPRSGRRSQNGWRS